MQRESPKKSLNDEEREVNRMKRRTYLDAGVLIATVRSNPSASLRTRSILEDPAREFVSSVFLRLETMPKAIYHRNREEIEIYSDFFASVVEWIDLSHELFEDAYVEACSCGMSAFDALHVVCAEKLQAAELITSELSGKPIFRTSRVRVVSLWENANA